MGYCATYYGDMKTRPLTPPEKTALDLRLRFWKDENVFEDFDYGFATDDSCAITLSGNSKYYEEDVKDFLAEIEPYMNSGEIEYSGEDETFWQFEFRNGNWYYNIGYIQYTRAIKPMFKKLEVKQ